MDLNKPTVKTVRVLLQNLDERQYAIFRMAFKMHNTTNYQLVSESDSAAPELVLVDGDLRNGTDQWHVAKQKYPQARVIYYATRPPTFTAPYLAKPIKFDTLFTNLRHLLQGNGVWAAGIGTRQNEEASAPRGGSSSMFASSSSSASQPQPRSPAAAERSSMFANSSAPPVQSRPAAPAGGSMFASEPAPVPEPVADAMAPQPADLAPEPKPAPKQERQESVTIVRFNTENTLLGFVQQQLTQKQDVVVVANGKPVAMVFSSLQRVLLAQEAEELEKLCQSTSVSLSTKPIPVNENLHEQAKIKSEAFVWQLAIWTAQGRLISPITPDTVLRLKSWPNMTRMAYLPESMRLSAFLIKTPVSLSMLYKLLPLDMADILNFVAATYATGYLHTEQSLEQKIQLKEESEAILTRKATQPAPSAPQAATASHAAGEREKEQPRGLLSRLMSRLRGK